MNTYIYHYKRKCSSWVPTTLLLLLFSRSVMSDSCNPKDCNMQASLSSSISWSLLKLMSIESLMSSNHLIQCHSLLLPSVFPSTGVFSSESALCIRWPKHWSFSFNISPSDEYSELIGEKVEVVTGFIFLDSKITVDGDCSHGFRRCLLLGKNLLETEAAY